MKFRVMTSLFAIALAFAVRPAAAQDAAAGAKGLHRSEVLGLPRHRRQREQGQPAGRRRREAVGGRIKQWIVNPTEMTAKAKSTKKPPMPNKYAAAGRGHRRARRLHAEPEVGDAVTRREALSHPLAIAGVVITTVAAVLFITLLLAAVAGMLTNPYAGLVVLVGIPALFVLGLLLIPLGVRRQHGAVAHPGAVVDWPVVDLRVAERPADDAPHRPP